MYLHPYVSSQIRSARQREKIARAEQQRLASQVRAQTTAAQPGQR